MKILKMLCLLCVFALFCTAYAADDKKEKDKDSIEQLTSARKKYVAEAKKQETEFTKKAYKLEQMSKKFQEAEEGLAGTNGLGKIEQLELKASLYGVEKQNSRAIDKEIAELLVLIRNWEATKRKIADCDEKLKLAKEIQSLKTIEVSMAKAEDPRYKKNEIKYYTVKKAATLSEISALDDVYANSDRKHYMELLRANPGIVKDPLKDIIPAGVTLKVPDLQKLKQKKKAEDFDDF